MATHHGAADDYYSNAGAQPQMAYSPQAYDNNNNGYQGPEKNPMVPPSYAPNYQSGGGPPPMGDGKETYEQRFKLEKPKYNDKSFAILVYLLGHRV